MRELDLPERLRAADPSDTLGVICELPSHVRAAAAAADAAELRAVRANAVLFCGMGGSGVGGDVAAAVARTSGGVPVVVHRSYGVPAWVDSSTFVVASSYSGKTEETVDAFRAARDVGASGLAVTRGGTLGREAAAAPGWSVLQVNRILMPRYAIGWICVAPIAVLERAGLVSLTPGWRTSLPELLDKRVLGWGPASRANGAKRLAADLAGLYPVVWGGDGASGVAAVRWKNDLNENAKIPAHAAVLPEADHNENMGYAPEGRHGRPGKPRALVCLHEPDDHPRVALRFDETVRDVADDFEVVRHVTAGGDDVLSRFCDLALLGEFVSTYLAVLRGIDPAPIASIERLKAALERH